MWFGGLRRPLRQPTQDQRPDFGGSSENTDIQDPASVYISDMDEVWEEPDTGIGGEPAGSSVVYRTQQEVDAIFARLRAWRDRGRTA